MNPSPSTQPSKFDALDFEVTDIAAARAALETLPDGIGRSHQLEPGYWDPKRRKAAPTDRALNGKALDWVMTLPPSLRPHHLCEHFPRVANALAEVWNHGGDREAFVESLLTDRRGNRAGWPSEVRRELDLLKRAMP